MKYTKSGGKPNNTCSSATLSWRDLILNQGLQGARPATNILGPNTAQPVYGKLTGTIKITSLHTP